MQYPGNMFSWQGKRLNHYTRPASSAGWLPQWCQPQTHRNRKLNGSQWSAAGSSRRQRNLKQHKAPFDTRLLSIPTEDSKSGVNNQLCGSATRQSK